VWLLSADADYSMIFEVDFQPGAGSQPWALQCCLEQCDVRSHVVSECVKEGSADAEDVVRASVEARPRPDVRGWVLLSRVRSSGESPRIPVPPGGHR